MLSRPFVVLDMAVCDLCDGLSLVSANLPVYRPGSRRWPLP